MKRYTIYLIAAVGLALVLTGCMTTKNKPILKQSPSPGKASGSENKYGNSNGNLINCGFVVSTEDYLFYADNAIPAERSIIRLSSKDSEKALVAKNFYSSLNVYANKLFYSDQNGIVSCDFEGKNVVRYYNTQCSFTIYDGAIYLSDNGIYRIDISSKKVTKLNAALCNDINVGAGKIYYTSQADLDEKTIDAMSYGDQDLGAQMFQMNLDGTGTKKLGENLAFNLIESGGSLYYLSFETRRVEKLDPTTGISEEISKDSYDGLNVVGDKIYCVNSEGISVLDLSGKKLKSYDTGFIGFSPRDSFPNIAANAIYFLQFGSESVYRIDTSSDTIEAINVGN